MDEDFIKELIKQVLDDMSQEEETLANEINVTGDVAGFDAPLTTKKKKRKLSQHDDKQ